MTRLFSSKLFRIEMELHPKFNYNQGVRDRMDSQNQWGCMLNKLKEYIKTTVQTESVDATRFNDPIALKTEWTPLKGGGSNFQTHKLIQINPNRVVFKATKGAKLFSLVFIVMGLSIPFLIIFSENQDGQLNSFFEMMIVFLFGLVFAGAGGYLYYRFAKPIVFDKLNGHFWKGWKKPDQVLHHNNLKHSARLGDLHALQLISEYVKSDKNSYYSYELNLVLSDGSRLNVIDHGSKSKVRNDANELSGFLGIPVWDSI